MTRYQVGISIIITVGRFSPYSDAAYNYENGDYYTHHWEHLEGLGFINPRRGFGYSLQDCLEQAQKAVADAGFSDTTIQKLAKIAA